MRIAALAVMFLIILMGGFWSVAVVLLFTLHLNWYLSALILDWVLLAGSARLFLLRREKSGLIYSYVAISISAIMFMLPGRGYHQPIWNNYPRDTPGVIFLVAAHTLYALRTRGSAARAKS